MPPLSTLFSGAVVFIAGSRQRVSAERTKLQGTAFVVSMPTVDPEHLYLYVVTAGHVVRASQSTFVQLRTSAGGATTHVEVSHDEWVYHCREDVAVAPIVVDPTEVMLSVIPTSQFIGSTDTQFAPAAGDDVVFAGLLALVPSMGERNIPMVRTGSIGAMYQDGIPTRLPDEMHTVLSVRGHLVDCRSFGGFSGSPCFVRFTSRIETTPRMGLSSPVSSIMLLGLVLGHFDMSATVDLPGQEDDLEVPVSAGIAVVLPAETIMETLGDEDLVAMRETGDAELSRELGGDEEGGAG